jgi:uncharacterized ferritin-like protein (DUF455 family)
MERSTPSEDIDFAHNKLLLNRYRFVEYAMLRILAGWLPATARMERKLALGRLLWEDAQHVQLLYQRLREIQTPAFRDPNDPALLHMMAEAIHAPNERDLLAGLLRVLKPALTDAYAWHIQQTFANPDAPTLYALKHILLDEREHLELSGDLLGDDPQPSAWESYIAELLAAAGGITGRAERGAAPAPPACRTPFSAAREAARDERFQMANRHAGRMPTALDVEAERLAEFESYSQEMLAAETVALILYLSPGMPWEFTYASARHCYDETRHCRLGIEWLARHGLDYTQVPQNTRIYTWRSQYDPATQYCLLTMGNEMHALPYRRKRLEGYRAAGDRLSAQFVSYDIADERQHVAYGKKWLPQLMAQHGIATPVDQFVEETVARWEAEYRSGALPLHRSLTEAEAL